MTRAALIAIVFSFGLVAGCASVPPPSGPRLSGVETPSDPNQAVLYIYRTEAEYRQNRALLFPAILNGRTVAELTENAYVSMVVEPGKHVIHTRTEKVDKKTELDVKPGDALFLRVRYYMRPSFCFCSYTKFELVDESQARAQLAGTRREIERFYAH
ncbi:DUF2846 domain-containing protein [Alkalilimnicola sp. S0819]|uniref:DUF2846 domain-containing protein n=1 Tax=Alkalilimnicola sp. S0819 TaxID=2613922 RepID=UPI00126184FA|nr:DUF2846 domain-containing protein [Alkalilimnicola sp. S0819]KAB7622713.1 DUF2846 domain-containing protein [Alkalilimnicola sp. S0819]MPQ17353.1 DUF2846 domain-containing protein [Alkalilimnicola sp. S0819]